LTATLVAKLEFGNEKHWFAQRGIWPRSGLAKVARRFNAGLSRPFLWASRSDARSGRRGGCACPSKRRYATQGAAHDADAGHEWPAYRHVIANAIADKGWPSHLLYQLK